MILKIAAIKTNAMNIAYCFTSIFQNILVKSTPLPLQETGIKNPIQTNNSAILLRFIHFAFIVLLFLSY